MISTTITTRVAGAVLAATATALTLVGTVPGTASAAPAQGAATASAAEPCGFFTANGNGYYRHCGDSPARIVSSGVPPSPSTDCVGPWETVYLGTVPVEVAGAHYAGDC